MRKIIMSLILSLSMVTSVYADTDEVLMVRTSSAEGTTGIYYTEGEWTTDVPLISMCSVTSVGKSTFLYSKNATTLKKKFVSHTIKTKIGGIGGGSISFGVGGDGPEIGTEISFESNEAVISTDTWNWEFYTEASIWRLYSYSQKHSLTYKLRKNGKAITTVTLVNTAVY